MQVKVMILGVGFFPLPRNIRLACVTKDPALGVVSPPPPPHTHPTLPMVKENQGDHHFHAFCYGIFRNAVL